MKKRKFTAIWIVLIILIITVINIKPIGRILYPIKYKDYIMKYSEEYNLNPYLVSAVIKAESNFEKNAKSNKGAIGLMQLTPSTAKWAAKEMKVKNFKVDMLYNEEFNIKMGCWYIDNLKQEFNNNIKLVLAAYNGGRGNVKKWLNNKQNSKNGIDLNYIPFKETDKYVKKVDVSQKIFEFLYTNDKGYIKVMKEIISSYFS
ncbi:lytic transglycosylase [Clostridium botulinum]|uniref:Lytic transglycosylase n=1 Tax=Clostridium botulinum C/D str. DC5 TaxID=1443128 RepID=A0A0A0IIY8_CLOBO|nr:lytic transglycosylase domain-containing protein [Clostridium botulinum]KEI04248.1 lytic transglycosylase [Clostridium botulinum C/D str. BKT75002]KEI12242.1 lytic transglycosylase [Clostridium botulinum C/D str. BKT2873]KGM93596.1 lytic transglycosylase [Clostridium botulinum D str. CCUG 7971]KGM99535.1 lytic transglycosylase [Clostridium botulinum C/D str. DC5]KOC48877.1 lytic transglycosylase [Clostridium botulinum]